MTRDLDAVLRILKLLESRRAGDLMPPRPEELDGMPKAEMNEYLVLLKEAGYVDGVVLSSVTHGGTGVWAATTWEATRLTWEGHEFLTAVRNPEVREEAEKKAGPLAQLPFEVVKAVVIQAAKTLIFGSH